MSVFLRTFLRVVLLALVWTITVVVNPVRAQFADQAAGPFNLGGAADAYVVVIPNVTAAADIRGVKLFLIPNFTNAGPATLNSIQILKPSAAGLVPLTAGNMILGQGAVIIFDGVYFQLVSSINSTAPDIVTPPGGRCSLTSNVAVMTTTVTAGTSVYYVPYVSYQVPIYNGVQITMRSLTAQLTLALGSAQTAGAIFDIFVFDDSGTLRIGTGPAWANPGEGTSSRGTLAGSTELGFVPSQPGILTNAYAITATSGGSTYSVPANRATYLCSILVDASPGQVSALLAYGASRKLGLWNYYNRVPVTLKAGDATASWNYASSTWRPSRNQSTNSIQVLSGWADEPYTLTFSQSMNGTLGDPQLGIGWNSTTVPSGFQPVNNARNATTMGPTARFNQPPSLGLNRVTSLEAVQNNTGTNTFFGTEANMLLTASWRY